MPGWKVDRKPPEATEFGSNDNPESGNSGQQSVSAVSETAAVEQDDGLPWPDPAKRDAGGAQTPYGSNPEAAT